MDKIEELAEIKKRVKKAQDNRVAYLKKVYDAFQTIAQLEAGMEVITYLLVQSRVFANALKATSNLKTVYNISPDYFLGQTDFGRNILTFLTEEQVAKVIKRTQKEDKNV